MHSSTALRSVRNPVLALLFLYALAHNWAGLTEAYFAFWQWVGAIFQEWLRHALDTGTATGL